MTIKSRSLRFGLLMLRRGKWGKQQIRDSKNNFLFNVMQV